MYMRMNHYIEIIRRRVENDSDTLQYADTIGTTSFSKFHFLFLQSIILLLSNTFLIHLLQVTT